MKRIATSLLLLCTLSLLNCYHFATAAEVAKPNILFLFADDLSHEALGAFGSEVETPNLDKLVKNGTTFTNTYNMGAWHGAVCVASRTMLNTGRFVWRAQKVEKQLKEEAKAGRFWSQYLHNAGYNTFFSGKWHVKMNAADIFDHAAHIRPGMPRQTPAGYNRPIEGEADNWSPDDRSFGGFWDGGKHWSEVLGDDAIEFLQRAKSGYQPFFMYFAFNAPHDPRQSPKEYVDLYPLKKIAMPTNFVPEYPYKDAIGCGKGLRDEKLAPFPRTEFAVKVHRQEYYAIISHMDAQIGRILDALEKSGNAENTYIFFTADHGLAVGHHGLLGKQNMFEHSMRAPLIVVGPDIPKSKQLDTPVYLQDVMPTTLEMAEVPKPEHVQFRSLLPLISEKRAQNYDAIYGGYMNLQRMVRKDNWKLIMYPKIKKMLLFNLETDPAEMHNLADDPQYAAKIKELQKAFRQLQRQTGDELVL